MKEKMLIEVCPWRQVYCKKQKGHISNPALAVDLSNHVFHIYYLDGENIF